MKKKCNIKSRIGDDPPSKILELIRLDIVDKRLSLGDIGDDPTTTYDTCNN